MWTRRQLLATAPVALAAPPKKPNVLFFSIDDLNDWVGVLGGHPQTRTPHIDRLARRGVRFSKAYCQAPMCNPSRTSLLTGLRPSTTGVYSNDDVWRDGAKGLTTLPEAFINAGYRAECFGKVFHSKQTDRSCWHAYHEHPDRILPAVQVSKAQRKTKIVWGPYDGPETEDADPWVAAKVTAFLQREQKQPFFLGCGFIETHIPWFGPKRFFDLFPPDKAMLPPYKVGDLDDVPKSAIRVEAVRHHQTLTANGQWKAAVAAYLACIHYVDEQVGKVLDALDASPYRDNTIIVLWADHGWHLGEKDHWQKFTLWERSCHVPLMISAPTVSKANTECAAPVELLDIYPTLIDLCGIAPPHPMDGQSLVPILRDSSVKPRKPAITSNGWDKHSVRTERWRYSSFPDGQELYDHQNDPNEWTNLAGKSQFAKTQQELAAFLPRNPSRKKLRQFDDLTPEDKRAIRGRPHNP